MEVWDCLQCGEKIGMWAEKCPYCGAMQFGENNQYAPCDFSGAAPRQRRAKEALADEEILAAGMYPKNKNYKMSLISRILGK